AGTLCTRSFPTRRSSDLDERVRARTQTAAMALAPPGIEALVQPLEHPYTGLRDRAEQHDCINHEEPGEPELLQHPVHGKRLIDRSEEHTSELQSRENIVC